MRHLELDALDALVADAVARLGVSISWSTMRSPQASIRSWIRPLRTSRGASVGPMATLRLMQLAQPHLLEAGDGNIINLATAAAKRGTAPPMACTRQRKSHPSALSRCRLRMGPNGARTNCILPLAKSPALEMWEQWRPEEAAAFAETVPMKRIGHCEDDIGEFVAALCSPESRYVNGQSIAIDGGQVNMG